MSEQKTKTSFSGSTEDVFRREVEVRRRDGSLSEVDNVILKHWKDGEKSSLKLHVNVTQIGYARQVIKLDPSNVELRKAIEDAYKKYDLLTKK